MAADGLYDSIPDNSIDRFVAVFSPEHDIVPDDEVQADPLLAACRYVAKAARVTLALKTYQRDAEVFERLTQLADDSQCRIREIGLTGEWWKTDQGPLLVFRKSDNHALALVPLKAGTYQLIDPLEGQHGQELTAERAAELHNVGYFFYRPLPDTKLDWKILLKFAFQNLGTDVYRLLAMQVLMGLLGLLVPIATGVIFDTVIPNADPSLLLQFVAALLVNTFAVTLFQTTQTLATIRIKFKLNGVLQPALWDRLLRLPVGFFRYFSSGNLADRAGGIDSIQQQLTGAVVSAILGGFFSVITLGLMFYYDYVLALYAVGVAFFIAAVNLGATLIQLRYQRQVYRLQGIISGLLLQLFISIGKLRIANRESAAFQLWAERFSEKTQWFRKAGYLQISLSIFSTLVNAVSMALLFLIVVKRGDAISFGAFVAFNAAFGQFFSAIFSMTGAVSTTLEVIPLYERAKPILDTLPETDKKGIVITPSGKINVHRAAFRYPLVKPLDDTNEITAESSTPGPWVFQDVSLDVQPGEFVALVGPSGAGKSTAFRLLLGFEKAEKGMVTFDNYDLATLNHRHLRRKIGVVMQNSMLLPGTILDNLRSSQAMLTLDDAKALLTQVKFDKDLATMPMGLFTLLAEGGVNLSAGQRQRLLIAKAIAHKPSILFLDEATSALDNNTQQSVYQFIEGLEMTRVVAAHRLSTIQHADKIYVLNEGKVEQVGHYDELMQQPEGLFAKLVARQQL